MKLSLRAAMLAGALVAGHAAVQAEPVTLEQALAQAAEHSPRVAQAKAKADAAEARARQAGALPNPDISLEVENFAGTGVFQGLRSAETTLTVGQRFELGGKRGARTALAAAERDMAILALRMARADLAQDICIAYAQLDAAQERLKLRRESIDQAQDLERTARLLVEVGRDPPLRQLRAAALLAEARVDAVQAQTELLTARSLLADLTGQTDLDISAQPAGDVPITVPPLSDAPTVDEQFAAAIHAVAQARVRIARADRIPDVTASAGVRRMNDGQATALVAGISIPLPIRSSNRSAVEAALFDATADAAALRQARLSVKRSQHDARTALEAAELQLDVLSGPSMTQAEEAVRIARIGYAAGKFGLLELVDAQAALTTAKAALIEARLDRARALAALIRANVRAGD